MAVNKLVWIHASRRFVWSWSAWFESYGWAQKHFAKNRLAFFMKMTVFLISIFLLRHIGRFYFSRKSVCCCEVILHPVHNANRPELCVDIKRASVVSFLRSKANTDLSNSDRIWIILTSSLLPKSRMEKYNCWSVPRLVVVVSMLQFREKPIRGYCPQICSWPPHHFFRCCEKFHFITQSSSTVTLLVAVDERVRLLCSTGTGRYVAVLTSRNQVKVYDRKKAAPLPMETDDAEDIEMVPPSPWRSTEPPQSSSMVTCMTLSEHNPPQLLLCYANGVTAFFNVKTCQYSNVDGIELHDPLLPFLNCSVEGNLAVLHNWRKGCLLEWEDGRWNVRKMLSYDEVRNVTGRIFNHSAVVPKIWGASWRNDALGYRSEQHPLVRFRVSWPCPWISERSGFSTVRWIFRSRETFGWKWGSHFCDQLKMAAVFITA